jgi:phosphoenolpyruvate carboxykinase (ATP)
LFSFEYPQKYYLSVFLPLYQLFVLFLVLGKELYEQAIKYEKGSFITSTGALATLSGAKTGRAPRDKRVVKEDLTEDDLWWGK